jgi:hypothetical protein
MESEEVTDTEARCEARNCVWILFNQQLCIPYMHGHTDNVQWPLYDSLLYGDPVADPRPGHPGPLPRLL